MRTSLLVVLLVACRSTEWSQPEVGSGSGSAPSSDPAPRVGPHSGAIEHIAVTDDGHVAYTLDTFGQARLWPTLDGTREPILARGGRATKVAFGRTEDGFVAALLDQAGGIELARFDRDGRTRGHVSLAPEPGFVDVLAVREGVLARRRDEFLVWYDAGGRKRGQIAPDPGERMTGIAVRRGRAIAALVGPDSKAITLRWITFDKSFAWGARPSLHTEVEAPIALSPDGTKVAAIDLKTRRFEIVSIPTGEGIYAKSSDSTTISESPTLGFLDDATAVFTDVGGTTWWSIDTRDPWATSRRGTPSDTSNVAVGDRVMLDSSSTSLTITTSMSVKYLGYRDVGPSVMWPTSSGIAMQRGTKSVWMDRDLRERVTHVAPSAQVNAIVGDHHLVVSEAGRIYLHDADTKEERTIGNYAESAGAIFEPNSGVLAITTQARIERFRIGFSPLTVTALASLVTEKQHGQTTVIDPEAAAGMIAIVASHTNNGEVRFDWYREPAAGVTEVKRAGFTTVKNESMPIGADRKGVVYFLDRVQHELVMIHLDQPPRRVSMIDEISTAVPHPDGTLVIVATASELLAFDTTTGEERWRLAVPAIDTLKLGVDGRTLFASARGGLVSIDARNGTRIATACGWNFGLHDDQVSAQVFGVPNLCAGIE